MSKVLHFRKKRSRPGGHRSARVAHRILGTLLGLFLFLALGSATVLFLRGEEWLLNLFPAAGTAFIALFGLNLAWQSVSGGRDQEGFFYAALRKGRHLHPAWVTLGLPAVLLVSLLVSWSQGSGAVVSRSLYGLVAYGVWLLHIGLHEWGHYLAAKGVGLVPTRVVVGPLEWIRAGHRWKLGLSRDWFSLLGGLVEAYPPSGRFSAMQQLKFALGGPLVTAMLLGALAYWNPYSFHELVSFAPGVTGALFSVGLLFGAVVLGINLIPYSDGPGGTPTDGYQIRSALRALHGQG